MKYDALKSPEPAAWLASDEDERLTAVLKFHKRLRVKLPNLQLHRDHSRGGQNQIAMGDELGVRRKLEQLLAEGLDRHEAVTPSVLCLRAPVSTDAASNRPGNAQRLFRATGETDRRQLAEFASDGA